MESFLKSAGYTVLTADDGEAAVELYRMNAERISLVVTDLGLPKMSGRDVFLRMKETNPDVKVILASGYIEPHAKAELMQKGAKSVVHKPFVPGELLKQIREALN